VAQLIEALRYEPEGRGFDSCVIGIFLLHNSSCRTMALGSTQPITGIFPGGLRRPVRMADNLITFMWRLS
jgi:hypothetical protein